MNKHFSFQVLGIVMTVSLTPILNAEENTSNEVSDEIIVTGGLMDESLLNHTNSVSILDQEHIDARQAIHAEGMLNSIPNVNFSTGASRGRFIQIRGIGERSQFVEPRNPSVGLTIDDLDLSGLGLSANLFDVAQMEVFRGPQGTTTGANGLAGLVHLKSNGFDQEDFIHTRIGNYNTSEVGLASTIIDSASMKARISAQKFISDGYMKNEFLDRENTQAIDEFMGRLKTQYTIDNNQSIDFNYYRFAMDNGYDAFTLDNSRESLADQPGFDTQFTHAASLNYTTKLDSVKIETILTRAVSELNYGYDEDWVYTGFDINGYSSEDAYYRKQNQTTAELRMNQSLNNAVQMTYGVYLKENSNSLERNYTYSAQFNSQFDVNTQAAYGQVKWRLTDLLQLDAGLRYEQRKSEYLDSDAIAFTPTEDNMGGHLSLLYLLSDNIKSYVSVSQGFKAGGFNTENTLSESQREYGSELLQSVEAGIRGQVESTFFSVSIFNSQRIDQQLKRWDTRTNTDGSTEFYGYLVNAESGSNIGAELTVEHKLTNGIMLFTNAGLLDAVYDDYRIADTIENNQPVYIDYSGRQQAHAPKYQVNAGFEYVLSNWNARLEWDAKDSFYFSDSHDEQSDPFVLMHVNLGYQQDNWKVVIYGRNILDVDYQTRGFGGFGNNPKKGYQEEAYYQLGNPRTLGISFNYQFN